MVYMTREIQRIAKEIYTDVKTLGQVTGQAAIEKKLEQAILEDRERILQCAKPFIFGRLPIKFRLQFAFDILFRPKAFLEGMANNILLLFRDCVNDNSKE